MRILHVQAQLPAKTGSGVYFSNVIKGFEGRDEQACIYGQPKDFEYDVLPKDRQYPVTFPNEKCHFPLPGMSDVMPYESTIYGEMTPEMIGNWQDVFRIKIQQAVAEFKPDVIFCHHLWFLTSLVCKEVTDIPIYVFCHGTDIRQANQHPDLFEKYVTNMDRLTHVFALSHPEVQKLVDLYHIPEDKITVVGGGYDPEIFYPAPKPKKDTIDIVYAGKISAAKGTFALARTFDRLSHDYPNVHLHIIGNASEEAKRHLDSYLGNPQILLYNVLSQRELADQYRKSDIFVLPSYYEGLGLVAIEALGCDLRAVVTNIPALKEQLGDTVNDSGYISYVDLPRLVNQDEPLEEDLPAFYDRLDHALREQIEGAMNKPDFPEDLQKSVLTNSWPQLIKRIEKII
ncbi:glycosyltransferase family 4 protein [Companilactobacillus sp.]|jgi:glycosyltransferase involved in cell wall biosynthesis|uniref:glycosyltransferase family 4 protein n=1 Tax=Companilactobacillus sp. TaxID=2767905 RepID=UPI0025C2AE95|nr:glycosyltransferase family 4 protein [Companilactobacillus sp.]MCH4009274.1 glycosyltransferase family 4 protein [Companilactobacillus sp.]MCH4050547.1 glycosyltransferase family 4 protein [Companilactobacillus sp.]MCH4077216.1 glycosyltransferase family 4 protein [Companilactobacillus sp.]MCH4125792.1 glycosyltransferase family 4 protein [Companilactobacillus sp.]MCI1311501.1 glycosyltransferase family 4 protein [Companilactobacillus sp.]